ncbi:MAG: hypothetical protein ACM3Q4_05820, partial [Acidobacteriota bacterium]
ILTLDPSNSSFAVAPNLGTVTAAGVFTAAVKPDSGYIYFLYKGRKTDSAYVVIKGVKRVTMTPDNIMTDSIRTIQFKATVSDWDNASHTIGLN